MSYLEVTCPKRSYVLPKSPLSLQELKQFVNSYGELDAETYYFTHNGKLVRNPEQIADGIIYAVPRLIGGKGGFGSMLRAIGAQIEKTTNREACRDLSGRRLRDINEEKRLKNWIAQQADREREAAEKRRKKLERMVAEPKHEFEDREYDKQRSELLEKVWDAVEQGVKASTSGSSSSSKKRNHPEPTVKTKKSRLWVDDIEDESVSSSCDSDESETEIKNVLTGVPKKETEADEKVKTVEASRSGDENVSKKGTEVEKEVNNVDISCSASENIPKKETEKDEEVKTVEASSSTSENICKKGTDMEKEVNNVDTSSSGSENIPKKETDINEEVKTLEPSSSESDSIVKNVHSN